MENKPNVVIPYIREFNSPKTHTSMKNIIVILVFAVASLTLGACKNRKACCNTPAAAPVYYSK